MSVHLAIAQGLTEELLERLGPDWKAEYRYRCTDREWSIRAEPKLRDFPWVRISLHPGWASWHAGYKLIDWFPWTGCCIPHFDSHIATEGPLYYEDPGLVPRLLGLSEDWARSHREPTVRPLPAGSRLPTPEEVAYACARLCKPRELEDLARLVRSLGVYGPGGGATPGRTTSTS